MVTCGEECQMQSPLYAAVIFVFNVDNGLCLHFFWKWEIGADVDRLVSCHVELNRVMPSTVHPFPSLVNCFRSSI